MDSHIITSNSDETSYTKVMGHMDVVSIVQDGFNVYFPILLIVLTLATYFSLGSRLLSFLGFQQFLVQEDVTGEFVEEGRELMKREKRRRERLEQSNKNRREETVASQDSSSTRHRAAASVDSSVRYTESRSDLVSDSHVTWSQEQERRQPPRNLFDDL